MMSTQKTLLQAVFQKCLLNSFKIITVESCTGGLICSAITDNAGSSQVFDKGLVTYSNESKTSLLGVSKINIEKYGAVSREVIIEMATNIISAEEKMNLITIATSGVAGPGRSEEKPVGLVWIASYRYDNLLIRKLNLGNLTRKEIRHKTVLEALKLLKDNLSF